MKKHIFQIHYGAKKLLMGVLLLCAGATVNAAEVVFIAGDVKILVDSRQNKMYCTYCGYGEQLKAIAGPVPDFFGTGSGLQNYFKDRRIVIVKTDTGTSCESGQYTAIDLVAHTSKNLDFPSCEGEKVTYFTQGRKAVMQVRQGKKVSTFTF